MAISRRLALIAPLLLVACANDPLPRDFPPLRYDFLTRIQLNVAAITYAALPSPGPLDRTSPVPPGPALRQLAEDRLAAGGSSGQAVVVIEEARVSRSGDGLDGTMALHLDIIAADGRKAGFAEARVARRLTGFGRDLRGALYDITKQMLDDMNVELEFQLRRSLRDYIQVVGAAPAPGRVEVQELPSLKPGL